MTAFDRIVSRMNDWTGLDLVRGGRTQALDRFIEGRVQALGLPSVEAYIDLLTGPGQEEVVQLINASTIGYTWFFRDLDHMEAIGQVLSCFPAERPIDIWVPACASGEDAYSLAMIGRRFSRRVTVLGTDINSEGLERARAAKYGRLSFQTLPALYEPYFRREPDGQTEVVSAIRASVRFESHNLLSLPPIAPHGGGWDLILCRNVLIYFSAEQALATLSRVGRALSERGYLFVGGGEVIHTLPEGLQVEPCGKRFALRRRTHAERAAVAQAPVPMPLPSEPTARIAIDPRPAPPGPAPIAAETADRAARAEADPILAGLLARAAEALRAERLCEAIALYTEVSERDPLSAESRMFIGIAYHLSGDASAAAQALRGALFLDPGLWPAAYYLAQTYEALGWQPEARREYRRVVETSGRALAAADSPIGVDLDRWKPEVIAIARMRAGLASEGP